MTLAIVLVAIPVSLIGIYLIAYFAARGWYSGRMLAVERYYKSKVGIMPPQQENDDEPRR